jgi:D-proline reductase (dithiol) PrdB
MSGPHPPFSYVAMMEGLGLGEYAALPNLEPTIPAAIDVPLAEATVGLFTSCGAILPNQRPFAPTNDLTFRLIGRDVPVAEVTFAHPTPVRGFAERDLNVAYPRDRLVELEEQGAIGRLADNAVSMLGSITTYTRMLEQTAPMVAEAFKDQGVDLVLAVPFCPACHRATSLLAKALEASGVPTVTITVLREMAEALKPSRPVFLDYPLGATAGRPGDPVNQREIVLETLQVGHAMAGKWGIYDLPFAYSGDDRSWEDDVRAIYAVHGREIHRARVADHQAAGEQLVGNEEAISIACAC